MAVDLSNSYTTEAFKLTETVKIPKNWTGDRDIKTRTQLLEARKKEFIPDISFDLDGDGVVGPQDYYVSKNFCKENNNKLTAQEKTQALEALKTGYTDNML